MGSDDELSRCVAAVRTLFGAAACSCALVDEGGEVLTYVAADGEGAVEILGVELPVGRGIAGWAAMSGQPLAVRDVGADPRFAREVAEATDYVPASMLVAPLFDAGGEVIGVVSVLDPAVDQTSDWTLAVLGTLAAHLAAVCALSDRTSADARWERLGRQVLSAVDEFRR